MSPPPKILHLPDGQKFSVAPVFAGMGFRSHEHNSHHHPYPIGWTTVMHTEEDRIKFAGGKESRDSSPPTARDVVTGDGEDDGGDHPALPKRRTKPFTRPTLQDDTLFISSIANPSNSEFKPAASPTRQIAMMLWVTMYWYFHQPEPSHDLETAASKDTPSAAKPRGEWRICIKRDGVLRGRNLIPKLERMGLIASQDSSVGTSIDDSGEGWANMFVTQRMFWQIPPGLFLFTLQPIRGMPSFPGSPVISRPGSPAIGGDSTPSDLRQTHSRSPSHLTSDLPGAPMPTGLVAMPSFPIGPFFSTSHLPTYYPPQPLQYITTEGVPHPRRPKPPRMGEVFYTRYIDSKEQYLSFRVASSSSKPVPYLGPVSQNVPENSQLATLSDTSLLQAWMGNPRVKEFWGDYVPGFLETALCNRHSFPVIGLWDGIPFGYFEVYWVKEDLLGRTVGGEVGDWDRGIHIMIGEEWSRGRVSTWLSSLVHYCLTSDYRTNNVCLEPRVDNSRYGILPPCVL